MLPLLLRNTMNPLFCSGRQNNSPKYTRQILTSGTSDYHLTVVKLLWIIHMHSKCDHRVFIKGVTRSATLGRRGWYEDRGSDVTASPGMLAARPWRGRESLSSRLLCTCLHPDFYSLTLILDRLLPNGERTGFKLALSSQVCDYLSDQPHRQLTQSS